MSKEIKEKVISYITAALGLVAGLAWNDAIKAFIEFLFPLDKNSIPARFLYAIVMTVVVVIVATYLVKVTKKSE